MKIRLVETLESLTGVSPGVSRCSREIIVTRGSKAGAEIGKVDIVMSELCRRQCYACAHDYGLGTKEKHFNKK